MTATTQAHDSRDRLARAALTLLTEPGDTHIATMTAQHGPDTTLYQLTPRAIGPTHGTITSQDAYQRAAALLERARSTGTRFVIPGDDDWPVCLNDLTTEPATSADVHPPTATPLGLWIIGTPRLCLDQAITVTGCRAASGYGMHVADDLARTLATAGYTVVSGAAYGIDAAAHRAALSVEGHTLAVLAAATDVIFPEGHATLLRRIGEHGALISPYPPGTPPSRHRFAYRGHLLAALSRASILVEATPRSSSLATARTAHRLGRPVWAIPGPITAVTSTGTNQLLYDNTARAVVTAGQIADTLLAAPHATTDRN